MGHRYSNDVKHIKILNRDGCFHIAENNKFGSILVSLFPFQRPHYISYRNNTLIAFLELCVKTFILF